MGLNPLGNPDWPKQTADLLESVTTKIRQNTTARVVTLARVLVFGLLAAVAGLVALVLVLIIATRSLQLLIAIFVDHGTSVWISYLAVGGLFCLGGMFLMAKRHAPAPE